jgi:AmiR/NasT family two-component response regulator
MVIYNKIETRKPFQEGDLDRQLEESLQEFTEEYRKWQQNRRSYKKRLLKRALIEQ